MTTPAPAGLRGCRIMVAEDEYLIADALVQALEDEGIEVLGPAARVAGALALAGSEARIDGAALDVNLRGEMIWPVVDALLARRVPVVLTTGYDQAAIPGPYAHLPRCEKPVSVRDLARALARQIAQRAGEAAPCAIASDTPAGR